MFNSKLKFHLNKFNSCKFIRYFNQYTLTTKHQDWLLYVNMLIINAKNKYQTWESKEAFKYKNLWEEVN